jgi:hypothetical protein
MRYTGFNFFDPEIRLISISADENLMPTIRFRFENTTEIIKIELPQVTDEEYRYLVNTFDTIIRYRHLMSEQTTVSES